MFEVGLFVVCFAVVFGICVLFVVRLLLWLLCVRCVLCLGVCLGCFVLRVIIVVVVRLIVVCVLLAADCCYLVFSVMLVCCL